MSDNGWETQPRKPNGEFTFRYEFWKEKLKAMQKLDDNPEVSKKYDGGSSDVLHKKYRYVDDIEVHHMPSVNAYKYFKKLNPKKGPCIGIDSKDHKETSSYKRGYKQDKFRLQQIKLLEQGHFLKAQEMDFINIIRKFKSKYAKAMLEKLEYDKQLYDEGVIND